MIGFKRRILRVLTLLLILGSGSLSFLIAFEYFFFATTIHPGVTIEGADVSGLTPEEAEQKVNLGLERALSEDITLALDEFSIRLDPEVLEPQVDVESAVAQAFSLDKGRGILDTALKHLRLWFTTVDIKLTVTLNLEAASTLVEDISSKVARPARDAWISLQNGQIVRIGSQPGIMVDKGELVARLKRLVISTDTRTTAIPVKYVSPDLPDDLLAPAEKEIETILGSSLKVTAGNRNLTLSPSQLLRFIKLEKLALYTQDGRTIFYLDVDLSREEVMRFLASYDSYYVPSSLQQPRDAEFVVDGQNVTIEPSRDGLDVNESQFPALIRRISHWNGNQRRLQIPIALVSASLSTSKAKSMGVNTLISTHTEEFDPSQTNRVHNIRLLTRMLDGILIAPGQGFSFNETTGPRTKEKGFQIAGVIINGRLREDYGGGVCNVSTTIFNTAFLGGYPIVQRLPHYFYISHYPPGRDATVSYGVQDFKFANDTEAWILVKAESTPSSVTVSFYSTDFGREVEFYDSGFSNFRPFRTIYEPDPRVPPGSERQQEAGVTGRDITVTRIVKQSGEVIRKDIFFSRYYPKDRIVAKNPRDLGGEGQQVASSG